MYERCVLKAEQLWVEWGRRHHVICQPFLSFVRINQCMMTKNYRMNEKDNSHQWHRWLGRKNPSTPNGSWTCDLLVSDSDDLPLSYRTLVRATRFIQESITFWFMWQASYILYCGDWNVEMCSVMRNDKITMVNFKPGEYTRKVFFFQSVTTQLEKTFDLWLLVQILYHRR